MGNNENEVPEYEKEEEKDVEVVEEEKVEEEIEEEVEENLVCKESVYGEVFGSRMEIRYIQNVTLNAELGISDLYRDADASTATQRGRDVVYEVLEPSRTLDLYEKYTASEIRRTLTVGVGGYGGLMVEIMDGNIRVLPDKDDYEKAKSEYNPMVVGVDGDPSTLREAIAQAREEEVTMGETFRSSLDNIYIEKFLAFQMYNDLENVKDRTTGTIPSDAKEEIVGEYEKKLERLEKLRAKELELLKEVRAKTRRNV